MKSLFRNISTSYTLAIIAGILVSILGTLVLIGWYTQNLELIQIFPTFAPMQFNTALCFVLSGMGLLMIIRQHRSTGIAIGIFIMFTGLLTLSEYIFEIDLGIDQLLFKHYITTETSHPGRMAPNTALCLLLTGIALIVFGRLTHVRKFSLLISIFAALILGQGIIALAGYAISFESAYGWGELTRMAVHTAGGLILIGMAFANIAWYRSVSEPSYSPFWLMIPAGIIVVMVMSYSLITGSRMAERNLPMQDAVMEIVLQATVGHLWLEEVISGDQPIDNSIIGKQLNKSAWYAHAMLEGGENAEGIFVPLTDPVLRSKVEEVLVKIGTLKSIAEKRRENQTQSDIGSHMKQRFDTLFKDFLMQTNEVGTALQSTAKRELHRFQFVQSLLLIFLSGIFIIIGFVILRYKQRQKFATETLQQNETHLRTLFAAMPDLLWLKDADGIYLNCNTKFEHLYGAKQTEIVGKTDYDFVNKELADFFRKNDKAVMIAKQPIMNEEEIIFADDGHSERVETIKTPMFDSDGKLIGVLGIARDITERKRMEAALIKSKTLLAETGRMAKVGGWELDVKTLKVSLMKETCHALDIPSGTRLTLEETINIFHSDDRPKLESAIQKVLEHGESFDMVLRFITAMGEHLWARTICKPVIVDGKTVKLTGIIQDITEQKRAEARAKEQELVLTSVFQALPDLFFLMDQEGTIREYHAQQIDDLYVPPDTFLGKRMQDVLPQSIARQFDKSISIAFKNYELTTFEYALEISRGLRQYEARISRLPDSTQILAIVRDITERKQVEVKLNDQLNELRRWHEVILGREGRNQELKCEVNTLLAELGRSPRYSSVEDDGEGHD